MLTLLEQGSGVECPGSSWNITGDFWREEEMPSFSERLEVGGSPMGVHISVPSGTGPFPGIVVCHDGAGVDRYTQEVTQRLAGDGYAAAAPELFHRITEDMLADGSLRGQHLDDGEIMADVNATVKLLLSRAPVNRDRLGIMGFCIGGRVSWLSVATASHFKVAVPFHGGNIMVPWGKATESPFELSSGIDCPIMFHFGAIDANPSQADMAKLDAELTRLGKPHQFSSYPGAGHDFSDYTDDRYHQPSAEAAWPRTLEFLSAHLK